MGDSVDVCIPPSQQHHLQGEQLNDIAEIERRSPELGEENYTDDSPRRHSFHGATKFENGEASSDSRNTVPADKITRMREKGLVMQANKRPTDFMFIKTLGEGAYSTVYLAREVESRREYAIKVIGKELLLRHQKNGEDTVENLKREKDIMADLTYEHGGHPFVVTLYCTFQDAERLYFAMSYCKKGDLLDALNRVGCFDVATSRFYTAEIVSGLQFLHKSGVVHRDLKPENILFQESGHICLTDFGSAKLFKKADIEKPLIKGVEKQEENTGCTQRRSTFVGTAQYVSPEMLSGGVVGPACDFWALGAIVFQLLSGQPPFRAVNDFHLMKKIQNLDFTFPDGFPDEPRDLVSKMLILEPTERMGCSDCGDIDAIMEHPFFEYIDWDILPELEPPALHPFVPAQGDEPACYSELTIEPGFDEKAIARLLGFNEFAAISTEMSIPEELVNDTFVPPMQNGSELPSSSTTPALNESLPGCRRPHEAAYPQPDRSQIRLQKLEKQRESHPYHKFVDDNLILKSGFLEKKKGLFARRRMFLLTEGPHLYYVDSSTMELKGEIPWSMNMRTEAKNFRTFFIHTPHRTYYLFDPERNAVEWCRSIDMVKKRYEVLLNALGETEQTVDPSIYKKNKSPPKKKDKKDKKKKNSKEEMVVEVKEKDEDKPSTSASSK